MRVITICSIFIIIELVAAEIWLKGDCDLSEVFHKAANYPDWSSCLSFKNESDQCGKETLKSPDDYYKTYSPVKAYEKILTKDFLPLIEGPPKTHNVLRYAYKDYPCIMDDFAVRGYSTYDRENQSIKFNSDTVEEDPFEGRQWDNKGSRIPGITTCAWEYGNIIGSYRYDITLQKFEVPSCNDCSCGYLDIYESRYMRLRLLKRFCSHNITEISSFESWYGNGNSFRLFIHFQTNVTAPKRLEIDVSSTPISIFDKWTQCNIDCGEGFQTRKLINTEICTATQYRSCWAGRCSEGESAALEFSREPVSNQCLNKMQKAQENFHSIRSKAGKLCGYFNWEKFIGTEVYIDYGATRLLRQKSQVNQNGCKPNSTDECKTAFLDYMATLSDLVDNDDLKHCYDPTLISEGPGDNRFDDFLIFTKDYATDYHNYDYTVSVTMKEYLMSYFEKWESTCKVN